MKVVITMMGGKEYIDNSIATNMDAYLTKIAQPNCLYILLKTGVALRTNNIISLKEHES